MVSLKLLISILTLLVVGNCMGQKCSCGTMYHFTKENSEIRNLISDGNIDGLKKIDENILNCFENYEESYLVHAVRVKQIEIVKYLLEVGVDVNNATEFGGNALHSCADDTTLAALLIESGIDINKQDYSGASAIMRAAQRGNISSVQFYINKKADLGLKDREGKTVVDYANGVTKIENNKTYKPIKALLKSHGAESGYLLREAVIAGDISAVREILELKKSPPDARDQFGSTVLVYTCNVDILSLLLEYGLDLNIKNQDDLTGLIFAARKGCHEAVEFYINNGVHINAQQGSRTALDNASSDDIKKLLLDNGARSGKS